MVKFKNLLKIGKLKISKIQKSTIVRTTEKKIEDN